MAKPKKKYSNLSKKEINYVKKKLNIKKIQDIDITILKKLKNELKQLKDKRNKNMITYKLWDVVMCVILASFAYCNDWEDIEMFVDDNYKWLKSFLQMTGGIPKANSYERIISLVDDTELNKILFDFFKSTVCKLNPDVKMANFDGRVNNGSKRNTSILNDLKTPLNCLNCYSNEYGYCIETIPIDDKTNEIPTIETLISGLNLKGVIATWDALNTQTKNIDAVINAGGDYIVPIKGNHGIFYEELKLYFDNKKCEEIIAGNTRSMYYTENEKSHSSYIKYEYFQTSDIDWYQRLSEWNHIQSFGLVRKTITKRVLVKNERKNAKKQKVEKLITTTEYRYYISSKQVNIKEFSIATRQHWNVENKLHWHLDFTFCQDNNSTINKKALLNLEIIHKFVLAILDRVKVRYSLSLKSIRKHLSNNFEEFLPELFCYLIIN
mgnify:CR=1 FL=1